MKKEEYVTMYETEEEHWWFKGKRKIVFSQLEKHLHSKKNLKILDIGCGTGMMMKNFQRYGKVNGIDIETTALNFCHKRGLTNIAQADIESLPFRNNNFDVVSIFDVLYHKGIKNDVKALKEIFRTLKASGIIILTDSADMKLWSRHDIAAHARERYTLATLSSRMKTAGFKILKMSYFNTILYPLVFIVRKLDNMSNKNKPVKSNIKKTNPILNSILYLILAFEGFLLKFLNFPFGVSIFVIAKKN